MPPEAVRSLEPVVGESAVVVAVVAVVAAAAGRNDGGDKVVFAETAAAGYGAASAQQARRGLAAHAAEREPSPETTAVATGLLRGVEP